jgi:protein-S-isoprenylcysteine O-methyltransferase Ste14
MPSQTTTPADPASSTAKREHANHKAWRRGPGSGWTLAGGKSLGAVAIRTAMKRRLFASKLLALLLFALALVATHAYAPGSVACLLLETSGFLLLVAAAMGRVWASALISGRKNLELVTDGPYSIVRHPLYFFSFLGFLGAGMAFESLVLAVAFGSTFLLTHWPAILREENRLHQLFGDEFRIYQESVPRFLPHPWKLRSPVTVPLFPRLFTKAIVESSLILCVFLLARIVEWCHLHTAAPTFFSLP